MRRTTHKVGGSTFDHPTDMELVAVARSGDESAFGELWNRHYENALHVARQSTRTFDAEDIVQEAFTILFASIRGGGGPSTSFRAYLMTTVKNVAAGWGRRHREDASDALESHLEPVSPDDDRATREERDLTRQAFTSLPERWQNVLWLAEVEELSTAELATTLGLKAGAVAQLAFRAREGLRDAYIQAHLRLHPGASEECAWFAKRAGAVVRGTASSRDMRRASRHLAECEHCRDSVAEARHVNRRLALLLPPLIVGGAALPEAVSLLPGAAAPQPTAFGAPSDPGSHGSGIGGKLASVGAAKTIAGIAAASLVISGGVLAATAWQPAAGESAAAPVETPEATDESQESERAPETPAPTEEAPAPVEEEPAPDAGAAPPRARPVAPPVVPPTRDNTVTPPDPSGGDDPGDDDPGDEEPGEDDPGTGLPDIGLSLLGEYSYYEDGYLHIVVEVSGAPGFELIGVVDGVIGGRAIIGPEGIVTFEILTPSIVFTEIWIYYQVLHEGEFPELEL